ncbi:MAG: hypothetical protein WKF40_01120 [Thermoleophilaceae bacterium]
MGAAPGGTTSAVSRCRVDPAPGAQPPDVTAAAMLRGPDEEKA